MIKPEALKPGDKVAIVATARKVDESELYPAVRLLEKWKLKPILGNSIGKEDFQFAGSDEQRVADFQNQLDNPDIKAIWCARGGYGSVRIIDQLDFSKLENHSKWIIGYSDITVFHAHLNDLGLMSLHAQMPVGIAEKSPQTSAGLKEILDGNLPDYQWPSSALNQNGMAQGELVGGNLSVLYSLCGSPSIPEMEGRILFLEDLDEYLYHVDRMMQNLKRNGWFEEISGLIVGGMSNMRDNTKAFGFEADKPFGKTAKEIIKETLSEYDFPIAFDFPAGHQQDNRPLIMGHDVVLTVENDKSHLSFK